MDNDTANLNTPEIPATTVIDTTTLLVRWLRTFWTKLYKDKTFLVHLQASRAERVAQLYLDVLENARLLDHKKAPVFHRERWYPIVVRENMRNDAGAAVARLGDGGLLLGADHQTGDDGAFSSPVKIGEHVDRADTVSYAVKDDVKKIMSCVVDDIVEPHVVLREGADFKLDRRSIVLRKELDPFSEDSKFPVFEVPETPDSEATREAVLWACDAMIDKDYVFKHVGYAVGIESESTTENAEFVKTVWDATTDGLNVEHLQQLLGSLCRVPVILEDVEKIESVYRTSESTTVVTDRHAYVLGPDAVLRDAIRTGNSARRGDLLDCSVKIYPFVVDADDVKRYSGFDLDTFKKDVASLAIPGALISGDDSSGFYVEWAEQPVEQVGVDSNGNPRYRFDIGLDEAADARFWEGVWAKYEKLDRSMAECFDSVETVSPLKFFLRNLVGANTLIVVIDTDRIPEDAPLYNPSFFNALRKLVPAYVRMYFVEYGSVIDDQDGAGSTEISQDTENEEDGGALNDVSLSADAGEYDETSDTLYCEDEIVNEKWARRCHRSKDEEDYDD